MKKSLVHLCLVVAALLLAAPTVGEELDPARLTWSKGRLAAKKGMVSLGSDIEIQRLSKSAVTADLIEPGRGQGIQPKDPWHLQISTKILGASSVLRVWFNAGDGATLQRTELEAGRSRKRDRLRTYRYTDDGVYGTTQRPGDDSYDHPERWAQSDDYFDEFPDVPSARVAVTEPAALFYLLSVADLSKPGDRLRANLFTKGKVVKLTVVVEKISPVDVDYVETSARGERRVKETVEALELSVEGRPAAAGSGGADFKLLGLSGKKQIFLSPTLRIPILLTGKIESVGKGRIELKEVTVG